MKDFDRIVSYGCSHMAALETVDIEYHPEADQIKEKHGYPYFRKNFLEKNKNFKYTEYVNRGKENSWPVLLSKKLGVDCVNRANPGNSIFKIVWNVEEDISSKKITSSDLIFIDLVSPFRFIDFSEKEVDTLNLNRPEFWKSDLKEGASYFLKIFNNDLLIFNYLLALERLIFLGQTYQIFYTIPHRENLSFLDSSNRSTLKTMKEDVLSRLKIFTFETLLNDCVLNKETDRYYIVGHAKHIVHGRFTEKIYKELSNKKIFKQDNF